MLEQRAGKWGGKLNIKVQKGFGTENVLTRADSEGAHHVGWALVVPGAGQDPGAADPGVTVEPWRARAERGVVYGVALRVWTAGAAVGSLGTDVHAEVVDAGAVGRAVRVLKALELHASNPKKRTTFN